MVRVQSGQVVQEPGFYVFVSYLGGGTTPPPKDNERSFKASKGDRVPQVGGRDAIFELKR